MPSSLPDVAVDRARTVPARRQGRDRHRRESAGSARASRGCSTRPARAWCSRRGAPNGSRRSPASCRDAHVRAVRSRRGRRVRRARRRDARALRPRRRARQQRGRERPDARARRDDRALRGDVARQPRRAVRARTRVRARRWSTSASGGAIVNVASIWGLVGVGQIPEAGYAASKGGLVNLTRELAAQWARRGRARQLPRAGLVPHRDDRRPDVRRRERANAGCASARRWAAAATSTSSTARCSSSRATRAAS